ncbi:conserved hypothetical protein [Sideroxydans lithotrophicus ES-1]|uniref:Transmembrane protein n=2 Tax=Sideroxydans TaxID=314343 RepID=D5CRG9_SIDLE|nr:conserved hypothetical protein [Sideroxydans lithotrophicus ES-1]
MKMRYLAAWFVMLVVAMINGALRDFTYGRQLPALLANQLSCASGIILLGAVIYLYQRRWAFASARQAWVIGLFWMALTMAFEFLFFHYAAGHPWSELLENYDIVHGRLWPLILLWVAVAPYFFFRLAGKRC